MFSKNIVMVVITILILIENSVSVIELTRSGDHNEYRIVCYYGSWAASRPGAGRFTPEDIDPFLCTNLLYAFVRLTKNITFEPLNEVVDIEQGGYAKFTGLKKFNKKLRTSLSLGGWNEGSVRFASIAVNSTKRNIFIQNCIEYLRKHNFDGLDLDWQFPDLKDKQSYSLLIKELREGFEIEAKARGVPRLRLAITLPTLVDNGVMGYDIALITKYVDCMHALTYNYHTEFEPLVNHHSPLYGVNDNSDHEINANYTMSFYLAAGAERKKLALGIPTYGKVYNLSDPNLTDIGSPAVGPGLQGDQTHETGFLAYYEICRKIKDEGWIVKQPYPNALGQYAYKGNQWVSYDDENIVRKKGEYVAKHGLGGIMFWLMEYDDFHGYCNGVEFPLIEAAKEALLNAPKYTDKDNSNIVETTPKQPPIVSSAEKPWPNRNKPVVVSSTTQRITSSNVLYTNPTQFVSQVNKNKNGNEVGNRDDEKYKEDTELLKLLQNFLQGPNGIAKLNNILNTKETSTSQSEPSRINRDSPHQQTLNAYNNDNGKNKQTHKSESDPNDMSQLFDAEEFEKSRILNVVFHIKL